MFNWIQKRWANRTSDNILRHGAIYFFFVGTTTIVNIAFRKYASVNLVIEDYGVFTALLAFYAILAQPINVMQMVVTKNMAYYLGHGKTADAAGYFKWVFKIFVLITLAGVICLLAFSPLLREQYQLPTEFSILLIAVMFFLAGVANCCTGALQAFQRFGAIGLINTLVSCIKVLSCYLLLHLFFGDIFPAPVAVSESLLYATRISVGFLNRFDIPLLAILIAMTALIVFSAFVLRKIMRGAPALSGTLSAAPDMPDMPNVPGGWRDRVYSLMREFLPIFILLLIFSIIRNIDEYMARRFLSEFDNGLYGALSTVAKSSIFFMTSIAFVTFPKFAAHADDPYVSRRLLYKSLLMGGSATLAFFVPILLFPDYLIQVLTHAKYLAAAPLLKYFYLAFIPYPFIFIFVHYFIVHRDWWYTLILLCSLVLLAPAYEFYNGAIHEILLVLGGTGYTILAFSLVYWLRRGRQPRTPEPNKEE